MWGSRFGGSLRMGNLLMALASSSNLTIYSKTALVNKRFPPILGWRRRCTRKFLLLVRHGPTGEPKTGQVTYIDISKAKFEWSSPITMNYTWDVRCHSLTLIHLIHFVLDFPHISDTFVTPSRSPASHSARHAFHGTQPKA